MLLYLQLWYLFSLHQGPHSVPEFAVEFRCLAAESSWNDEALQGVFHHGLNDNLKDELVSHKEPGGLDELISLKSASIVFMSVGGRKRVR